MINKTYIIAEAGVNHNGSVETAKKLIVAAKKAGADAVKFQTFKTENIVTKKTNVANYQIKRKNKNDQYTLIKKLELAFEDFSKLKKYAERMQIEFLSTPDDEESLDFLVDVLNIKKIKIGSAEITNEPFLKKIALKNKPIILSTGMANLAEIARAVNIIRKINKKELVLLHCTTNYPCEMREVNLRAILTLQKKFSLKVGYSDHTLGSDVAVAAVALGAKIIEKHLTLNSKMEGPDHAASLLPEEFLKMVKKIRNTEICLGNGVKKPFLSEIKNKQVIIKRVLAARHLVKGHRLSMRDLCFKRANKGIFVKHVKKIVGMRLKNNLKKDQVLKWCLLLNRINDNK